VYVICDDVEGESNISITHGTQLSESLVLSYCTLGHIAISLLLIVVLSLFNLRYGLACQKFIPKNPIIVTLILLVDAVGVIFTVTEELVNEVLLKLSTVEKMVC